MTRTGAYTAIMPTSFHYPLAPLDPDIEGRFLIRSWVRTVTAEELEAVNSRLAGLPGGAVPEHAGALAAMAALDLEHLADETIAHFLAHPDERVVSAFVAALYDGLLGPGRVPHLPVVLQALAARAMVVAPGRRIFSPLDDIGVAYAQRAHRAIGRPVPFAQSMLLRRRLRAIGVGEAALQALDRPAASPLPYLGTPPTEGADRDAFLASAAPLTSVVTGPSLNFHGVPPRVIESLATWCPEALPQIAIVTEGAGRDAAAGPLSHLSAPALSTLHRVAVRWARSTIEQLMVRPHWHGRDLPGLLAQLREAGSPVTPAEWEALLGGIPAESLNRDYADAPGGRPVAVPPHEARNSALSAFVGALQDAVHEAHGPELETLVLALSGGERLASLFSRVPLTPRLAEMVINATASPLARARIAEDRVVRHHPSIERRLVRSSAPTVAIPYLRDALPERFAHYFRRISRRLPLEALNVAIARWAEVHDFMDPGDFTFIGPRHRATPAVAERIRVLSGDLVARELGTDPGPLPLAHAEAA